MKQMYSVQEVAEILKLSDLTVRRYLDSGKILGYRVGRFWRIDPNEIAKLLHEKR